ncbi:aminotransferase class V-fold PLP-dependent enzyme, partial [Staphylococcus aureus]|uniref:aminotransferase class V-fold PLP-dependent enzyme n=1 Tax=Staphylococcus aureus TaxID=1280 RepID=UPI001C8387AB
MPILCLGINSLKKLEQNLRVIPVDDTGQIILEELPKLINERTKLLSITQV